MRSGTNSTSQNDCRKTHFSLDITGPVMPHHVDGLISLLDVTQDSGEFSSSFGTYMHLASFNVKTSKKDAPPSSGSLFTIAPSNVNFSRSFFQKLKYNEVPVTMKKLASFNQTYDWEM